MDCLGAACTLYSTVCCYAVSCRAHCRLRPRVPCLVSCEINKNMNNVGVGRRSARSPPTIQRSRCDDRCPSPYIAHWILPLLYSWILHPHAAALDFALKLSRLGLHLSFTRQSRVGTSTCMLYDARRQPHRSSCIEPGSHADARAVKSAYTRYGNEPNKYCNFFTSS